MKRMQLSQVSIVATAVLLGSSAVAADPDGAAAEKRAERTTQQASSDTMLAAKVKTQLAKDDETKARQINVDVYRGQVQLSGYVTSPEHKAAATRVVTNVPGVLGVQNNLQIKGTERSAGAVIDDGLITAKVKAALIGDSRTKAHQIDVDTREGVVQLGGFVDSADAKAAASEVAETVSGVRTIHNRLEVKR